ncbi:helix-turn-helix transcriptional regulator [Limosilactobacillus coleohominis]|uniref:helix-turn-helix domain-containing protein n=1 Tax=Limosilactobacillus coleohominis TaxID=181675 RepID=UPI0026EDB560|nr:helix-turn-helix transcriptional regulator [Limosilactobacillus coleohominis]
MENKSLSELFAINLRVEMAKQNVHAKELSKKVNVSRNTINLARSGKAKMIKFSTITELSKALKIEPQELFKDEEK